MTVRVDREKLSKALEDGMDPSGCSFYNGFRMSFSVCGETSTATKLLAQDMGFPAKLILSKSELPFGVEVGHAMTIIEDNPDNPLVIDPTWGQFLRYVGWDEAYDKMTGRQILPNEVLTFRLNDSDAAVRKFAQVAIGFKKIEQELRNEIVPVDVDGDRIRLGCDWVPDARTEQQIVESFGSIWNPSNFQPFEPNECTLEQARRISKSITGNIFTVG